MKKAQITNVEVKDGKYIATYASGVKRTYKKATKTIEAWMESHKAEEPAVEYESPFFKDKASEVIFYLTQADGGMRMNYLQITKRHYYSKDLAKTWRDGLMKIVHPDNCRHPLAGRAAAEVTRIYEDMIGA